MHAISPECSSCWGGSAIAWPQDSFLLSYWGKRSHQTGTLLTSCVLSWPPEPLSALLSLFLLPVSGDEARCLLFKASPTCSPPDFLPASSRALCLQLFPAQCRLLGMRAYAALCLFLYQAHISSLSPAHVKWVFTHCPHSSVPSVLRDICFHHLEELPLYHFCPPGGYRPGVRKSSFLSDHCTSDLHP